MNFCTCSGCGAKYEDPLDMASCPCHDYPTIDNTEDDKPDHYCIGCGAKYRDELDAAGCSCWMWSQVP